MTLAELKKGDRARIISIHAAEPAVQRLMVLGLVEGAELRCLGASLGGDPLEFRIYGSAVSLRRADARHFEIDPLTPGPFTLATASA
jgi:Fe2+ transport system protein FeoA